MGPSCEVELVGRLGHPRRAGDDCRDVAHLLDAMTEEPDYVTVLAHRNPFLRVVAVMKWQGDEYRISKVSEALRTDAAEALARSWAAALKLELR